MDTGRRSQVDAVATERDAPVNDRREIFGWTMYDWANSTFSTTVVTVLLGPYLTALAQAVVGENGVVFEPPHGSFPSAGRLVRISVRLFKRLRGKRKPLYKLEAVVVVMPPVMSLVACLEDARS